MKGGVVIAHIREKPPLRTTTEACTPFGRRYRWASDEPDPVNVPSGERHSDTMPGGFEQWSAVLPRKPGVDYADLERLTTITVRDAGGQVVGEYRLDSAPRTSGDQMAVSPAAVGYQAHLDDDKSAVMPYIDRDLGRWRDPGSARRIALAATVNIGETAVVPELSGTPALVLSFQGPWTPAAGFRSESYYEAPPGSDVASVYMAWATNGGIGTGSGSWTFNAFSTDDEVTLSDASADQLTGAAGSGTLTYTPASARRMAVVQLGYQSGPAGADGSNYEIHLSDVAVLGNHGLTLRGDQPATGFYASDVVSHAVGRWAPQLRIANGSVQQSSFIIPHLAFLEPTTAGEIIRQASRFDLPDWAVWENKTFWWTERGAQARRWRARIGPSELEETGPQVDRLWESIVVSYQDVDGTTRTVGPPGSDADTESVDLKDFDPENPANKLGLTRRDLLQMGTSTPAGATEVGRRFLAESRLLDRSGRARAVGWVEDDRGVLHPYHAPRAGDEICFVDASDRSWRRIVRTEKDHDARSVSFDLDAPPEGLAQLLERLGVVLVPIGVGS